MRNVEASVEPLPDAFQMHVSHASRTLAGTDQRIAVGSILKTKTTGVFAIRDHRFYGAALILILIVLDSFVDFLLGVDV